MKVLINVTHKGNVEKGKGLCFKNMKLTTVNTNSNDTRIMEETKWGEKAETGTRYIYGRNCPPLFLVANKLFQNVHACNK